MHGYPVKHVANCFLQRDFEDRVPTISPMKIQKLVYCLHGWHLAITDRPAIHGRFEAWPYGPVEENLYHVFKGFGGAPIKSYALTGAGPEAKAYVVPDSDTEFKQIFDFVVSKYMPFSALQLSALTHQPGTPWSITRDQGGGLIDDEMIKQHFRSLANG